MTPHPPSPITASVTPADQPAPWRVLELFSGLGGWRAALGPRGHVVAAYDIDRDANRVYQRSWGDQPLAREIGRLPARVLAAHGADTWLLSPPCQPFCRMGERRDLADRRSFALRHLITVLAAAPPVRLALENVPGFLGSAAHAELTSELDRLGFQRAEWVLCPTQLGIPNRRPRAFLIATREPGRAFASGATPSQPPPAAATAPLAAYLDPADEVDPATSVPEADLHRHWAGLDLVRPSDTRSACFIGGYGQRYVGSGSFLLLGDRTARRFAPREIARLLGFPPTLALTPDLSIERRYRLLGNSLAVPVATWVLDQLR
jgi:DNA (cytosine-5)-methyltransferase 1